MKMFAGLCGVCLLAGCATGNEVAVDAGSPFPSWCAEEMRQYQEMPSPRSGDKPWPRLPDECVEKTEMQLFPRVPKPVPER